MKILLTNDDGVAAEGLLALKAVLEPVHETVVVAPERGHSGLGHGITLNTPLRVHDVTLPDGSHAWSVGGTPADCVKIAVHELLRDRPVDLVVSGINHGSNVGINVFYSGTVAGALEGSILGIPAVAVSLEQGGRISFPQAARIAAKIIGRIIELDGRPGSLFSINIPDRPPDRIKGVRITRQNVSRFSTERFDKRTDPWGRVYYWIEAGLEVDAEDAYEDTAALREGYVSITPLKLEMTDLAALEKTAGWTFDEIS